MDYSNILRAVFASNVTFTRNELKQLLLKQNPDLKDSTFGWIVYRLCHENTIKRIAHNTFILYDGDNARMEYKAKDSYKVSEIKIYLSERFPLLIFAVWETQVFNEFANHYLDRNYVFVEVEKPLEESVFDALKEELNDVVLYKPIAKEIVMYSAATTVAVLPLITEAPIDSHSATLEKMLVDLFANKLLGKIISRSEFPYIIEEAVAKYQINYNVIARYAKRRNKYEEMKEFFPK